MTCFRSILGFLFISLLLATLTPAAQASGLQAPDCTETRGEDGYDLWLRYQSISDAERLQAYREVVSTIIVEGDSPTLDVAQKELLRGLKGLLDTTVAAVEAPQEGTVVVGTPESSALIAELGLSTELQQAGPEGYLIRSVSEEDASYLAIAANEDVGALYGVFHLLRLIQTHSDLSDLDEIHAPRIEYRVLNHWDNLDRFVERGYAGFSIWDWHRLPDYLDPRYTDYARANASLGINGTVVTNVNADATSLTPLFLERAAALADVFRPYGIQLYLTARFSAPIELGDLDTADPADPEVQAWWDDKVEEIYEYIPDFGGFAVKADSEGQPGPHDYDRDHAQGANMLARALAPYNGVVMWRAFVYSHEVPEDRITQAYNEFVPLDGRFEDNVFIQVKNGPLDFQPREPFHPLFGDMPETPLMMEFQITKEYLGEATHLAYLAPLYEEVLVADTYAEGEGSTVGRVIDGSVHNYERTGIAGVSNIGTDRDWSGAHFNQANWYAYGRLAWDHTLTSEEIAGEWIRMTFTNDPEFIEVVTEMMMRSREAVVNYTGPLGLHHLMAASHHYGPGPWVDEDWGGGRRPDWTATYYHRADTDGIGFDRTSSGSNAVGQYHEPLRSKFENVETTPEEFLLWFHRLDWDHEMASGRTVWEEMVHLYNEGVETVRWMQEQWAQLEGHIDPQRYEQARTFLNIQEQEAVWWRDASLSYFQTFSNRPIPPEYEQPAHSLDYYINLRFPYVPGI